MPKDGAAEYLDRSGRQRAGDGPTPSEFHLPGTYRGGIEARLQRLLVQRPDGTFEAAPDANASGFPEDRTRA